MADSSVRSFQGKSNFDFRSEWKIFAWCFVIAVILWILTSLNELYTSSLTIKARYLNLPKENVFVKPLPDEFKVMVTAKGWDLIIQRFKRNSAYITIDLNDYKKTDILVTRRLQDNFQQLMAEKINIGEVFPETISLIREEKLVKKVPVHLIQDIHFKEHYGLGGEITYSPDSITVSGPSSLVKGINFVESENLQAVDLSKPSNIELKLKDPESKNITYNNNLISVSVPVYELAEQKVFVNIEPLNLANKLDVKLIPAKVAVVFQTPVNLYNLVDSTQFQAVVDGSQVDTASSLPLKVQLINTPKYTYNYRISPDFVDYVIQK